MSRHPARQKTSPGATPPAPKVPAWPLWARGLISLAIIWQLLAILVGPLNLPPSILGSALMPYFAPYHRLLFIGHPYKFFAPDPGPSHLLEYDLELADGSHEKGRLPDRNEQWPRLLYHRHFMLTEFIGNMPPDFNPGVNNASWEQMPMSRAQQVRAKGYADHLLSRPDAKQVTLTLVMHALPSMEQMARERVSLLDERSYRRRLLGTYSRETP